MLNYQIGVIHHGLESFSSNESFSKRALGKLENYPTLYDSTGPYTLILITIEDHIGVLYGHARSPRAVYTPL